MIILTSIFLNYNFGKFISCATTYRKIIFIIGLAVNIIGLAYYKYTDFAIITINRLCATSFPLAEIALPIGISFFTFQQIAYLSDIYTSKHDPTGEGLVHYSCFICFFPQLVAGPIVHHHEMMPQFADENNRKVHWENIYHGLVILCIGLSKKVLIADNLAPIVNYYFDVTSSLTFLEACFGSLAYTLQLYFDFSGYSDMAIGCALFFNIHLPQNFNSPYKACDIQDFWRRWHITLSRWLREYLYIPLGGNRKGTGRTLANLFITFLLGGLWHGAAWTFVLWGIMHGIALIIHRIWTQRGGIKLPNVIAWLLTFSFINLAWIVFRVHDFTRIEKFTDAFLGYNGFFLRENICDAVDIVTGNIYFEFSIAIFLVFICIFFKNSNTLVTKLNNRYLTFCTIILFYLSMYFMLIKDKSPFLYFNF